MEKTRIVVVGGPNGAGKSTIIPWFLTSVFGVEDYVNADDIARGLSRLNPNQVAVEAGELMLRRINVLADAKLSFAFETTLSGRSMIHWLECRKHEGYEIEIAYVWLADPELAVARVAQRIDEGGHAVDEATIRRRFSRSLSNFMLKYRILADRWCVYNNSTAIAEGPKLIAHGHGSEVSSVLDAAMWDRMLRMTSGTKNE